MFCCAFVLSILSRPVSIAQTNTLDHYLEVAKNNSPLLKDLRNQVASTKLDSLRLRAGFKPQVNANSAGLYAPVVNGFGYSEAITNEHTLNALVGVSKAILSKNNIGAQLADINLQGQTAANGAKISTQDLIKSITSQYITAYGDLLQYKFAQEIIDLLSKEEQLLKKLTRANVYKQTDYLAFLVTLKQQQLQLLQAKIQYRTDYTTLNYLSGIADTTVTELAEPKIERSVLADPGSSVFLMQYKIDSLKLQNQRKLVELSYKPKISLNADGGYNSDFMGQAYKNFGLSGGFSFTMPIYDGGQKKLQYQKLSLEEETRQGYEAFFKVQYRQQIAQLKQQIADTKSLIAQIDEQIKYTENLIKVDSDLLQTGDLKIADLILAINNYLTIKNLRTTTNISQLQLINQLNYFNK
jgi:outer membrane protein TolC